MPNVEGMPPEVKVRVSADVLSDVHFSAPSPRFGASIGYRNQAFFRTGYLFDRGDGEGDGPSLGFGLATGSLVLDIGRIVRGLSADAGKPPTYVSLGTCSDDRARVFARVGDGAPARRQLRGVHFSAVDPAGGARAGRPRAASSEAPAVATEPRGPVVAPAGIARARAASGVDTAETGPAGSDTAVLFTPRDVTHHDWWIPVASAVMPGAGQARLGQDRFVGYMAVEGFLWVRYLTDRRAGIDARNAYRDMALRVSRAAFPGDKPTGNFEYYERMEHWIASGVYDGDPGAGFAPESDTTTFNGKMWSIARTTYWSDPKTPPPSARRRTRPRFASTGRTR